MKLSGRGTDDGAVFVVRDVGGVGGAKSEGVRV